VPIPQFNDDFENLPRVENPEPLTARVRRWLEAKRAKYGPDWWRLPEHEVGVEAWLIQRYGKPAPSAKVKPWTERDRKLVDVCIRLQREAPDDHARLCPNCLRPEYHQGQ
jgi:hypothetical protein